MRLVRWSLLIALLASAVPMSGCSKGNECDSCSSDSDCQSGLYCRNFLDDNGNVVGKRCGSGQGLTTCRVRH
jgi:hypothetical protein